MWDHLEKPSKNFFEIITDQDESGFMMRALLLIERVHADSNLNVDEILEGLIQRIDIGE